MSRRPETLERPVANERHSPSERPLHLSVDEAFTVLRNGRRRAAIERLSAAEGEEAITVDELARSVASDEHGVRPEHVTSRQRKCAYVSLLQVHLPKLDDVGLVEWNERVGTVAPDRSVAEVAGLIDCIDRFCEDERG